MNITLLHSSETNVAYMHANRQLAKKEKTTVDSRRSHTRWFGQVSELVAAVMTISHYYTHANQRNHHVTQLPRGLRMISPSTLQYVVMPTQSLQHYCFRWQG